MNSSKKGAAGAFQIEARGKVLLISNGEVQAEEAMILCISKQGIFSLVQRSQTTGIRNVFLQGEVSGGAFHPEALGKNTLCIQNLSIGKR